MKPKFIPERYEAQRMNHEYLRAEWEQKEIERARIREYCGTMHPAIKAAFWLIAIAPAIAATIYFLTK